MNATGSKLTTTSSEQVFAYSEWESQLPHLRDKYYAAKPFPHIVIDNFLTKEAAQTAYDHFPKVQNKGWINYVHYNEKKFGKNDQDTIPTPIKPILDELNCDKFVSFLRRLTGLETIFSDSTYEGGGLHQTLNGGFLNLHADFTVHPHHRDWQRRVNLLVYLNPYWKDSYGGHLELWDQEVKVCHHRVLPLFNRAVIFNTDYDSFHGQPIPLTCPADESRKSIALYYFSKEDNVRIQSTEYRPRPEDGFFKKVGITADKHLLRNYDKIKRMLKVEDDFVSDLLGKLHRARDRKSSNPKSS